MAVPAVRPVVPGYAQASGGDPDAAALARAKEQLREPDRTQIDSGRFDAAYVEPLAPNPPHHRGAARPDERSRSVRNLVGSASDFGPLQPYLDDPTVEELWINEPGRVFVARGGVSELTTTILGDEQVRDLVERMLMTSGRRLDLSQPFVDASLPDGSRLHVVIPDVTRRHWAINIRRFVLPAVRLDELVALGALPPDAATFLEASVAAGLNIVVAGGTQAGKTTMLNCLAAAIPGRERIITCEEVFELRLPAADWVALQTRLPNLEGAGEIPLRRLVKEALRMRPDRLIVGEVRQDEALDMLIALNSGIPGMATIHANSARETVTKLCTLPLLASPNISHAFVVPTVASAIDLVVHVAKDARGQRRVREIVGLVGPGRGVGVGRRGHRALADLRNRRAPESSGRADGFPPHPERYGWAGFDLSALLAADRRAA